jgi:hypothetical protein
LAWESGGASHVSTREGIGVFGGEGEGEGEGEGKGVRGNVP